MNSTPSISQREAKVAEIFIIITNKSKLVREIRKESPEVAAVENPFRYTVMILD